MTKMRGIFRRLAELAAVALVAVLIVITFLTLQMQFAAGPAPTGWPAGTQPYPGPAPTDAYPGPVATLPPMAMTLGGPTAVVLTPGKVLEMSTEMPLPSGTPRPTVTRRPGPTATAFPRATLPPDASGTILYLVNDQASIWAISVDGLGVGAGDGTQIPLSLDTTPDAVVPSPDGRYWLVKLLLFQGYQLYIVDTQQRQTWPLFRDETSGDPPMWFHGWHPDSRQVLVSRDGDALLLVNRLYSK